MQRALALSAAELDARLEDFLRPWKMVGMRNIDCFADNFCEQFGIQEIPRDPRDYLPMLGIQILNQPTESGERASWMSAGGHYIISVQHVDTNPSFALWHEFFEIISAHEVFPSLLPVPQEERIANAFAVNVLMPEDELRRQAAELHHPEQDKTDVLVSRFGVSWSAMRIRLRELGLAPRRQPMKRYF